MNFIHQNMEDTIVILNEVTITHPWCDKCDTFILQEALASGRLRTKIFKRGAEWKCCRIVITDAWEASGMDFRARYHVLENVETFNYLVWLLLSARSDWKSVVGYLWKAQQKWGRFYCMIV